MSQKLFFIHVPKCAGRSIVEALPADAINHWHNTAGDYAAQYPEFAEAFKLGAVRHPFDRFVSAFYYLKQQTPEHPFWEGDVYQRAFLEPYLTLHELLEASPPLLLQQLHFRPQWPWFGCWKIDCLLRYETLERDWESFYSQVGRFMGARPELTSVNGSQHPHWDEILSRANRTQLRQLYAQDMQNFGYQDFACE